MAALLPDSGLGEGRSFPIPNAVAARVARFHLADNTRGEPPHWRLNEIRALRFTGTAGADGSVTIEGAIHLETTDGSRGFEGEALGNYAIVDGKLERFEMVAVGDFWGEGRYTRGARPGKSPIGFSFELQSAPTAADRIPPQGSRWLEGYYGAER